MGRRKSGGRALVWRRKNLGINFILFWLGCLAGRFAMARRRCLERKLSNIKNKNIH